MIGFILAILMIPSSMFACEKFVSIYAIDGDSMTVAQRNQFRALGRIANGQPLARTVLQPIGDRAWLIAAISTATPGQSNMASNLLNIVEAIKIQSGCVG